MDVSVDEVGSFQGMMNEVTRMYVGALVEADEQQTYIPKIMGRNV